MKKENIRSFRFSDRVADTLGQYRGDTLNEKFENIVSDVGYIGDQSDEIVNRVFKTVNYDQFKDLLGNREVEEKRFEKIEASMLIKQLPIPIVVNEKLEVIDGQGRLAVCKKHGMPVWYMVIPGLTLRECRTVNVCSTKWSNRDELRSYAKTGCEDYVRLLRVMDKFNLKTMQEVLNASGKSACGRKGQEVLHGGLCFTTEDEEMATRRLSMGYEVIQALRDAGWTVRQTKNVRDAIVRCAKEAGYDHDRMVKACRKASSYRDCTSIAATLQVLAGYYNKGRREDFMDTLGERSTLKVRFNCVEKRW